MSPRNWLRTSSARKTLTRSRLAVERLEDRTVPATFLVTDTADSGPGSLRDAVAQADGAAASGAATIRFDSGLAGSTIVLSQGQLELSGVGGTITIDGSGLGTPVTISGNHAGRVFVVDAGVQAVFDTLIVTQGDAGDDVGGGIANAGTLTLKNSTISDNAAYLGGGIDNVGTLTASNCKITGNTAVYFGAGFADSARDFTLAGTQSFTGCTFANNSARDGAAINSGGNLTVSDSGFTGNTVQDFGGAISAAGHATISDSTFSGNSATIGGAMNEGDGTLSMSGCTVSGNSASVGGGLETNNSATTVSGCTFSGNSAPNGGDINNGYFGGDSRLTVSDTTLSSPNPVAGVPGTFVASNAAFAQAAVSALNAVTDPGTYTLNLTNGSYHDVTLSLHPGVVVVVNGTDGSTTFVGIPPTNTALTAFGVPGTAAKGFQFSGPVATFTDVPLYNQAGDFQATINWGDGHTSAGVITYDSGQQRWVVSGSHTYASVGDFGVRTDITDPGGHSESTLGTWSTPASAAMPWTAVAHVVASLGGKIYVYSGWDGLQPDNQFAVFDPATGTWTQLPAPSPDMARYSAAMAAAGGKLYLIGGRSGPLPGTPSDTIQQYDPATRQWQTLPVTLPAATVGPEAVTASNGDIYVFGGSVLNDGGGAVFDPVAGTVRPLPAMPVPTAQDNDPAAVAAPDGSIYVIGGGTGPVDYLDTVRKFTPDPNNPADGVWETITDHPLPNARFRMGAVLGADGRIYVLGGNNGTYMDDVEAYTPGGGWAAVAPLPIGVENDEAAVGPDGRIYVFGGDSAFSSGLNTVQVFDPTAPPIMKVVDGTVTLTGTSVTATEGASFTATVATFTDANPAAQAGDFQATISWGDGHNSAGAVAYDDTHHVFTVTGSTTYAEQGSYPVSVTVTYVMGNTATASAEVTVAEAPLTARPGGSYDDPFTASHDYGGGNVSGTIWDGVFNADHLAAGDANLSNPGQLTWSATVNSGWENDLDNGPVLYKNVTGDFDVSVKVSSITTDLWSDGGLIARVPAATGSPENYVALRYFGALGFNSTRDTVDGSTTNNDYPVYEPYLRITRTGDVFSFYTRPDDHSPWVLRDTVSRPDIGSGTTMQVGLWFGTFLTGNQGSVQFTDFHLGAARPLSATQALPAGPLTVANFTDLGGPEDVSDYAATIHWGDPNNTSTPGTIVSNPDGSFSVLGSYAYPEAGNYTVGVSIVHGGLTTTVDDTVAVAALTPQNLQSLVNTLGAGGGTAVTLQASDEGSWQAAMAAVNAVTAPVVNGAPVPFTVVLNVAPGTYTDLTYGNGDPNIHFVLNGSAIAGATVVDGHSPALTVTAGNVTITRVTFTTATDSPTIQLSGGRLNLRNDVVQESTGFSDTAIKVTGGTVDLGTAADPGGNTINVNGAGQSVSNTGGGTVSAVGTSFLANGTPARPAVGSITAPVVPVQKLTAVTASAGFSSADVAGTYTAIWNWGDNTTPSAGTVTGSFGAGTVTGTHTYSAAGVYTVTLTVTDAAAHTTGQSVFQYVVVYDPTAGFVTGGGWINSPAGAYAANPNLTGKANFGFVSKYQNGNGVPTGDTQFQLSFANFSFKSTSYDWMVISGAKVRYKGSGTVNGSGNYGFQITAWDGDVNGGGGVDRFRIKIWNKATGAVVYDNQMGAADDADPTTALGGGSIVIHK